jgi:hypothetical protein
LSRKNHPEKGEEQSEASGWQNFPARRTFSDMIGLSEMPQISNLDSTKTAKAHDPSLLTARSSSAS